MNGEPAPVPPCDELRLYWFDHLEGTLDGKTSRLIDDHLLVCADCRAAYEREARMQEAFDGTTEGARTKWLMVAGRFETAAADRAEAPARRRFPFARLRLVAAAAAVLLGVGAFLWPTPQPRIVFLGPRVSGTLDGGIEEPPPVTVPTIVTVEIDWPGSDRPMAGEFVEAIRGGKPPLRGRIQGTGRGGRLLARFPYSSQEPIEIGDEVRRAP